MTTVDRAAAAPPVRDHSAKRRWVGQSIRRVEDPKFLLGRGGYIADRITPSCLHAAVLRSPHAHARIVRIEAAQAKAAPGVHAVITGAEAAELCDPMPDFGPDPARHTWRCLAAEKVRYVGEGVAVVVADSRYLAEDALELIEVEYEPLPPVTDPERALAEGAPLVHEALESNCAYERTFDFGDVDRDFAEADLVVRDRLRWHRSGRAEAAARGGRPLHRHRADLRAGAERLLRDRVLVLVRRARRAGDLHPGIGVAKGRRHRRDHRDPVLLRVLGQQPGDDGLTVRRGGVRLQPV